MVRVARPAPREDADLIHLVYMSEFLSALVGAVVGGALAFAGSWWQTRTVLEHEREQARTAAIEERDAARRAMTIRAVSQLLQGLARLTASLVRIGDQAVPQRDFQAARVEVRRLRTAAAPLVGAEQRRAWEALDDLLDEWFRLPPSVDELGDTRPGAWDLHARASLDVLAYAGYVKRHLVAVLDDTEPPAPAAPPVLTRNDGAVWPDPGPHPAG